MKNEKLKIYIAGPMRGIPGYNMAAFDAAAKRLAACGWDVINPAELSRKYCAEYNITLDELAAKPEYFNDLMRRELHMVIDADAIYMLNGWLDSVGANSEYYVYNFSRTATLAPSHRYYESNGDYVEPSKPAGGSGRRPPSLCKTTRRNKMNEYTKYIRCHIVEAKPMTRGDYNKYRGWELPANEDPADEGYIVKYPNGYVSWCPKAQFEKQGFPLEDGSKITEKDICNFKLLGYQTVGTMSAPDGKPYTLTEMVYPTGFTDFATSACVDPKNYSEKIGGDICIKKINDRLWVLLGFVLQWAKNGLRDVGMEIAKKADAEEAKHNNINGELQLQKRGGNHES